MSAPSDGARADARKRLAAEVPRWSDLFGIDPAFPAADPLAEAWDSGYHVGLNHGRGGARLVHESGETVDCNPFRQSRTETGTALAAVIAKAKSEALWDAARALREFDSIRTHGEAARWLCDRAAALYHSGPIQ